MVGLPGHPDGGLSALGVLVGIVHEACSYAWIWEL